jgi:hypothetical protein
MPHHSRSMSVGIDHWATATSIVKCVHPCQSCRIVRDESISHINHNMRASVSISDRKARASMLIIEQQPHRSRTCVHHCRSSGIGRIDRQARASLSIIRHQSVMRSPFSSTHTGNFLPWRTSQNKPPAPTPHLPDHGQSILASSPSVRCKHWRPPYI